MNRIAKTYYIMLGMALTLSSCSQEDMPSDHPDSSDRRIVFQASLPEMTTRAKEITSSLSYFKMTAFDVSNDKLIAGDTLQAYFYHKEIRRHSGSDKYLSDECMWPEQGRESDILHFFAYYPAINGGAKFLNETNANNKTTRYKIGGFKVAATIADQVDFVTAYTTGTMEDNYFSGINLNFRHQLSRIEIKAKGTNKSCTIEIAGVRIANAAMQGDFEFQTSDPDGKWTLISKGDAEYIFREDDAIVTVRSEPISILGNKIGGGNDNCAMLIPSTSEAWDYAQDVTNSEKKMYLNVLLRIIDKTNTPGKGKVQYPYFDNSQGLNAMNIQRVYLAVDNNGKVKDNPGELYKGNDGKYYTNQAMTAAYNTPAGCEVKEFGWAALPISADWQPGNIYTYTLDYSSGVGLHGPDVVGSTAPKAGDPIISDRVGVSVTVNDWQGLNGSTTSVELVPGS